MMQRCAYTAATHVDSPPISESSRGHRRRYVAQGPDDDLLRHPWDSSEDEPFFILR